jgi:hypothetical protein
MSLLVCSACDAFVPVLAATCPSCGAARPALPRVAARAALAASFVTTLMACYGGPPPHARTVEPRPATEGSTSQTPPCVDANGDGECDPAPAEGEPPLTS